MGIDKTAEIIEELKKIGLTEYEAKAYFFLSIHSSLPAEELCRVTGISPSRIYDVLSSLEKLGLATNLPGKPKKYQAIPPFVAISSLISRKEEELTDQIKKTLDSGKHLSQSLESLFGISKSPEKEMFVGMIDGREGLIRYSHGLFKVVKKEVLVFAGDMAWLKDELENFRQMTKKGVKIKIFGNIMKKNQEIINKARNIGIEIKQKPKGLELRGFMFDGNILYVSKKYKRSGFKQLAKLGIKTSSLVEDYAALISHHKPLIRALRNHFFYLWEKVL